MGCQRKGVGECRVRFVGRSGNGRDGDGLGVEVDILVGKWMC